MSDLVFKFPDGGSARSVVRTMIEKSAPQKEFAIEMGMDQAAFSKRFSNDDSPFWNSLVDIERLMQISYIKLGRSCPPALLQFWAKQFNCKLVHDAADEHGVYERKKRNGELPPA